MRVRVCCILRNCLNTVNPFAPMEALFFQKSNQEKMKKYLFTHNFLKELNQLWLELTTRKQSVNTYEKMKNQLIFPGWRI